MSRLQDVVGDLDLAQGRGAPGRFQLYIDGSLVGNAEIPYTTPLAFNPGAMTCGANPELRAGLTPGDVAQLIVALLDSPLVAASGANIPLFSNA